MGGYDVLLVLILAVCSVSSSRVVDDVLNEYLQQRGSVKRNEGEGRYLHTHLFIRLYPPNFRTVICCKVGGMKWRFVTRDNIVN